MNMKKIMPGLLAAFILMIASSSAQAGKADWSFSINLNQGHPTYGLHIGAPQKVHNTRWRHSHKRRNHRRINKRARRHNRNWQWHRRWGHRHGHHYHAHKHRSHHRHH